MLRREYSLSNGFQDSSKLPLFLCDVIYRVKKPSLTTCVRNVQEKRYRSMQEHIRRAHPDYYIPKLPATEESFRLMIETAPVEKPKKADSGTRSSSLSDTRSFQSYANGQKHLSMSLHATTMRMLLVQCQSTITP